MKQEDYKGLDGPIFEGGLPIARPLPGFHLIGEDGNAFSIIGRWSKAARKAGVDADERAAVISLATTGNYAHLVATFSDWEDADAVGIAP